MVLFGSIYLFKLSFRYRYMVGVEGNMEDLDLEMTRAVKWCRNGFNF